MLFWVSLFGGLALVFAAGWLVVAMARAERRARRNLYRSLGLAETTVEFLMGRNSDVLTELTYVRHGGEVALGEGGYAPTPYGRNVMFLRPGSRRSAAAAPPVANEQPTSVDWTGPPSDGQTRH